MDGGTFDGAPVVGLRTVGVFKTRPEATPGDFGFVFSIGRPTRIARDEPWIAFNNAFLDAAVMHVAGSRNVFDSSV